MRLEHAKGTALLVTNIAEEELCAQWNKAHPEQAVQPGDSILEVNGVSGDPRKLVEECKKPQRLNLRLRRGEENRLASAGVRPVLLSFNVFAAPSTVHGWGVFAKKDFKPGEVLHEAPGRLIRGKATEVLDDVFEIGWNATEGEAENSSILGLGFASLHNHNETPNCEALWERSPRHGGAIVGTFYALRHVSAGEELCIHYGDTWWTSRRANATAVAGAGAAGGRAGAAGAEPEPER